MFRYMVIVILGVALQCGVAPAQVDQAFPGCFGSQCVVRGNPGGRVDIFLNAASEIQRSGGMLVIDGGCASACAVAADMLRKSGNVCITKHAVFGFHKAAQLEFLSDGRVIPYNQFDPPHSRAVRGWVKSQGGFPRMGSRRGILPMPYAAAKQYWRTCG
jgi:hypothetical protein